MFRKDIDSYGKPKKIMSKIDKIYDDFENRTCKNCKHSGLYVMGYMPCLNEESLMFQIDVFDEFGCNKFKEIKCQ
jgi:DNA recombination-dependent growth factor C